MNRLLPLLALFLAGASSATQFYLSAIGADTNDGTTTSTPWKTLAKVAASKALFHPGDSILLRRGDTWLETLNIIAQYATSASRITYGAYGTGAAPLIDAQHSRNFGVYIDHVNYVTVQDIDVTNALYDGFRVVTATGDITGVTVQRGVSSYSGRYGFSVEATPGVKHVDIIEFRDDLAEFTGNTGFFAYHASDMPTGVNYYTSQSFYSGQTQVGHGFSAYVANNIHYHNVEAAFTGVDPTTGQLNSYNLNAEGIGICLDDYTNNSTIEGSFSHDNRTGMVVAHQGSNNRAQYNAVTANKAYGVVVNGASGANNIKIFNNLIYNNVGQGITVWSPSTIDIEENVISHNTGYGIWFSASGVSGPVSNNIIFGNTLGATAYVVGATGTITVEPQ